MDNVDLLCIVRTDRFIAFYAAEFLVQPWYLIRAGFGCISYQISSAMALVDSGFQPGVTLMPLHARPVEFKNIQMPPFNL